MKNQIKRRKSMEKEKGIFLFVYGTLKKGFSRYFILEEAGAEFVGDAKLDGYVMYDLLGEFPAIVRDTEDNEGNKKIKISGEVYKIDEKTLEKLDYLEGVPPYGDLYRRITEKVELEKGGFVEVYIYVFGNEKYLERYQKIKEGVWKK